MVESSIKFSSSESSSENDLLAHRSFEENVSSDDWRAFDYSPLGCSEKEDPEEEEEDEDDEEEEEDDDNDSVSDSDSDYSRTRTRTPTCLLPSERGLQSYLD